jgi:hypothetical protein
MNAINYPFIFHETKLALSFSSPSRSEEKLASYFHHKPPLDVIEAVASSDPTPIIPKVKL